MLKKFASFALVVVAAATFASCNDSGSASKINGDSNTANTNTSNDAGNDKMGAEEKGVMVGGANMVPSKNIVENASNSADHTTLVTAVKTAGLVETLSGTGPFTVFAPTNEAFNKLPTGTVDKLLQPAMKADLTKILTYHVVSGSYKAADLKDGQELTTVQGQKLKVSVKDGKVMINGANVTIADVVSSNGVTHVIDGVLMPK